MKYNVWKLLEIAESANVPDTQLNDSPNWCTDVIFKARDGWKVVIFYDCGELDYISSFINPNGIIIDFWDWPESKDKSILMAWRGNGDLERLQKAQKW